MWYLPALIWVALVSPLTMTGLELLVPGIAPPLPSWPLSSLPQHSTAPSERRAQVWKAPALTAIAETLLTTIRSGALVRVPSVTVMFAVCAALIRSTPPAVEMPFVNVIEVAVPKATWVPPELVTVLVPVPPAKVRLCGPSA